MSDDGKRAEAEGLFPPTIEDLITCAEREVRMREQVYPGRIAAGRMRSYHANREIMLMRAIVDELKKRRS